MSLVSWADSEIEFLLWKLILTRYERYCVSLLFIVSHSLRENRVETFLARNLVPGDIVYLSVGDRGNEIICILCPVFV